MTWNPSFAGGPNRSAQRPRRRMAHAFVTALLTVLIGGAAASAGAAHAATLTVSTLGGPGSGHVTSDPSGIDCADNECAADFPDGSTVTLTAAAAPGSTFSGYGDPCGTEPTCDVVMDGDQFVQAAFDEVPPPDPTDIGTPGGPLTSVQTSDVLNCAVNHTGDGAGEFYGNTACGTLLATALDGSGTLYGPAAIPAGGGASPLTPFTAGSQAAATGAGTSADPRRVVTTVAAGDSGLGIVQTDSYVYGQESYTTQITVTNSGEAAHPARLWHAGDCYLQDSDAGFGRQGPNGATACVTDTDGTPGARIEQFQPLTAGSHSYEAGYNEVWTKIGSQAEFDDTCACDTALDNGAGLSWDLSVPAHGSRTVTLLTTFSPTGDQPLVTTKTADGASRVVGTNDGYTITLSNPNTAAAVVNQIHDELPAGFSYRAGTSSGATTSDPTVSGRNLTWSGSVTVPAASGGTLGTASLHFGVTVSSSTGTYMNNADAASDALQVIPTGDTAPVTVTSVDTTAPDTTITSGPTGLTKQTRPSFGFSADDTDATFECKLDAGDYHACTSPFTPSTGLPDGAHTFTVRATDQATNTDPTPATRTFTVDTTAPDTAIDSGPTGSTTDHAPAFAFHGSEPGSAFACRLDTGPFAPCTSPKTLAGLTDGPHQIAVQATDLAGNTDATPATRSFTVTTAHPVDTTPPDTVIDSGPSGSTDSRTPAFTFHATEAASTFACAIDSGAFAPCTSPRTTATLAPGTHTFRVRATDAAGNADPTPATRSFDVIVHAVSHPDPILHLPPTIHLGTLFCLSSHGLCGYLVTFTIFAPVHVSIGVYFAYYGTTAHPRAAKAKRHLVLLASKRVFAKKAGGLRLRLKPKSKRALALIRRTHGGRLIVKTTIARAGQKPRTTTKTIGVKR